MKVPVVWTPAADADLMEARAWYDDIRPELGDRFAEAVVDTVEAIAENPRQFPVVHKGRRRAGVWRFPYGLFFDIQDDPIVLMACLQRSPRSQALARTLKVPPDWFAVTASAGTSRDSPSMISC